MILDSLAELVVERSGTEFSMQEVADRAGVSLRTLFRHFPSRQNLLDGLAEAIDERLSGHWWQGIGGSDLEGGFTSAALIEAVPEVFEKLDELMPLSAAMVLLSGAGAHRSSSHERRTEEFRALLADRLDRLEPGEAERTFAIVRHLASSATWFNLREEFGLSGREAGEAVSRALATLLGDGGDSAPVD